MTENAQLSVQPLQKPYPPMWMQSRDPETLEYCAANGIHTGYFLVFPRDEAAPRYRKYLTDWDKAGWSYRPNIAYSTVVYVDESDQKALDTALFGASRAYEGFLAPPVSDESFEDRVATHANRFNARGVGGGAKIMANLFDPDYLLEYELVFIGSPETVAENYTVHPPTVFLTPSWVSSTSPI